MSRVDERGYVHPTDDDAIPTDDLLLLLAKVWEEGLEAGLDNPTSGDYALNPYWKRA